MAEVGLLWRKRQTRPQMGARFTKIDFNNVEHVKRLLAKPKNDFIKCLPPRHSHELVMLLYTLIEVDYSGQYFALAFDVLGDQNGESYFWEAIAHDNIEVAKYVWKRKPNMMFHLTIPFRLSEDLSKETKQCVREVIQNSIHSFGRRRDNLTLTAIAMQCIWLTDMIVNDLQWPINKDHVTLALRTINIDIFRIVLAKCDDKVIYRSEYYLATTTLFHVRDDFLKTMVDDYVTRRGVNRSVMQVVSREIIAQYLIDQCCAHCFVPQEHPARNLVLPRFTAASLQHDRPRIPVDLQRQIIGML